MNRRQSPLRLFAILASLILVPATANAQLLQAGPSVATPVMATVQFVGGGQYQAYWNSGTIQITISVSPLVGQAGPYTVQWKTADGTAMAPTDYTAAADTAIFGTDADGNQITSQTISVAINNNGQTASKTFTIALSNPINAAPGALAVATITISQPPPPPTVQFLYKNFFVKDSAGSKEITVTLSEMPTEKVTVKYETAGGIGKNPAVDGVNYKAVSGTLTFNPPPADKPNDPASKAQKFKVPVIDTKTIGPHVQLKLVLSAPTGATLGTPDTATLFILNLREPELPVDSIFVTDKGNGVGVDSGVKLGLDLDDSRVRYGYKWTVTRADKGSMEKSVMKQEIFSLIRFKDDNGGKIAYGYGIKDKDNPKGAGMNERDWEKALKKWEKDGALELLTLDQTKAGKKMEGTPEEIKAVNKASELSGKRFTSDDFPGYDGLEDRTLIGVDVFYTFRVTSELKGSNTITAVFKIHVEVEKVNGKWQKKAANTIPVLPATWPMK